MGKEANIYIKFGGIYRIFPSNSLNRKCNKLPIRSISLQSFLKKLDFFPLQAMLLPTNKHCTKNWYHELYLVHIIKFDPSYCWVDMFHISSKNNVEKTKHPNKLLHFIKFMHCSKKIREIELELGYVGVQ